uniref:EF-hand domain-containing protein n=1 Tax=Odontella aurita TaxID=265563 RepID=A0A7S4J8K4_9STRA|mmetsp:Transcript_41348/g.125147  ORF Transcript_41348/g.125147 Transcript_41348/m.125147 type:complete len:400 (+) Transcript_41348:341-1540(+)|eukprot:CAMPEP_0113548828 /NCGR_PEP_ID=MMETSP0015_2-20120614/13101_1 /TAXON_ID=2838 /ORGANISM="Odontella" /LENGTH=399 /DNA_ID=CAMNT_0000449483 /DNA_START=465 /DNA_END=1664 /DNA_ORIENTATION=+ /assembly_acc=CAM_ASM_000160
MHSFAKSAALSALLLSAGVESFAVRPSAGAAFSASSTTATRQLSASTAPLARTSPSSSTVRLYQSTGNDDTDTEIERLKAMAAKLRSDAAELEAEKAQALADAAEKAFRQFDTNQDGEISLAELKEGLEKGLKIELSDNRVKELMEVFDASGDGALQLDEFVTIDRFRNQLDALAREEKRLALEAADNAKREKEAAQIQEAKMGLLNEGPPTPKDKVVSLLPYLFPLMDGLAYGRFLLQGADASNPVVDVIAILYTIYRSIPFSGFVAFFALNILSSVGGINRLVRYNMQQAIFLDIALFFPGLIGGVISAIGGDVIPTGVSEIGTDAIFVSLLAVLGYCSVSSLLGITPDKIPLISQSVTDRMPTIDNFDDELRYIPPSEREAEEEGKKEGDKKDDSK